jgi:hypothetical protein
MKIKLPTSLATKCILSLAIITIQTPTVTAQTNSKQVNHQYQSWFSINTTNKLNDRWAILADIHVRRNHFMAYSNFEFLRSAIQYSFDKNLSFAAGYGHMWLHPTTAGLKTVSNEDRVYEQLLFTSKFHKVSILQRLRLEQRWQQKIVADKFTGDYRFTNRFRYLLNIAIPVFKNDKLPQFNVADELCMQVGKDIVNNPFDQNRFFIGLKQKISNNLNFDIGYMSVTQQKSTGYQYDLNSTLRLFFYYFPDLRKLHKRTVAGKD